MLDVHKLSGVDLVLACRAFVHVAERASFTDGAAAAGVPQSVASRRVAALEAHLGQRLFDRTTRRTALTPFGEDMLASAQRLVQLADALEQDAERARLRPLTLAVPMTCATRHLALLDVAAGDAGTATELVAEPPRRRAELVRSRQVRAALLAVPSDAATWVARLGVSGREKPSPTTFRLASLRPSRARPKTRRLWLQPEDDVPHIRDEVRRAGHRAGLTSAQIVVATTLTAAVAATLRTDDVLLCSRAQADELGLAWLIMRDPPLARGHKVVGSDRDDLEVLTGPLRTAVGRALGASQSGRDRS